MLFIYYSGYRLVYIRYLLNSEFLGDADWEFLKPNSIFSRFLISFDFAMESKTIYDKVIIANKNVEFPTAFLNHKGELLVIASKNAIKKELKINMNFYLWKNVM